MGSVVPDQWSRWPWSQEDFAELTRRPHGQLEPPTNDWLFYLSWRHSRWWDPVHLSRFGLQLALGPDWLRYLIVSSVGGTPKFPQVHYHADVASIGAAQAQVLFGLTQLCAIGAFLLGSGTDLATFADYACTALTSAAFSGMSVVNGMVIYEMESCSGHYGFRTFWVPGSGLVAFLVVLLRECVQAVRQTSLPLPVLLAAGGGLGLATAAFVVLRRFRGLSKPRPLQFWPIAALAWLGLAFAVSPKVGFVVLVATLMLGFSVGSAALIGIRINDRTPTLRLRKFVGLLFGAQAISVVFLVALAARAAREGTFLANLL